MTINMGISICSPSPYPQVSSIILTSSSTPFSLAAGCPEPKPNHALNCVEMGLAMISAIKDFDEDCHESVNMRVGIHTGTVLCGIVGKRRFKFDVWSNDVSLANKMESTGKPGMVHISEKTYSFLKEEYFVQEGDPINGELIGNFVLNLMRQKY